MQHKKSIIFCAVCVETDFLGPNHYINRTKHLINGLREHTNYHLSLLTDEPNQFEDVMHDRLTVYRIGDVSEYPLKSGNRFNMHLKKEAIRVAKEKFDDEIIIYCDCDIFPVKWDEELVQTLLARDFDIACRFGNSPWRDNAKDSIFYQKKIDEFEDLFYDDLLDCKIAAETNFIIKRNEKLDVFLDFWGQVAEISLRRNSFTYYDAVYFGTAMYHSKMNIDRMTPSNCWGQYGDLWRLYHKKMEVDFFNMLKW